MMSGESIYKWYKPAVTSDSDIGVNAYWFIFCGNKMLVKVEKDKAVSIPFTKTAEELNILPVRKQYLGTLHDSPCFSVEVSSDTGICNGLLFQDLYTLYEVLAEDIFLLAGKAIQIVRWDQEHQYCSRCGSPTETMQNERAKICPKCGFFCFPRLSPAVITAVFKGDKILLAHNGNFQDNRYSLIAGFVEPGETLEECVQREIREEVGVEVKNIKYFGSQPWPFPNSLMIGFAAEYDKGEITADGVEITDAGWYDVNNLPQLPGKISIARQIIDWYINWRQYEQT